MATPSSNCTTKTGSLLPFLALLTYTVAMLIIIPRHEPWADEAQAWLLARDSGLFELLWHNLRYEGTPGLWHLLLMLPARWMEYGVFNYISGTIAGLGAAMLLFRSPFPLWMRLLLPFTFFFFFQYGVVARSYCLLIPLLFSLAVLHPRRFEKPGRWFILLLLLSHVSLHGSVLAVVIFIDHLIRSATLDNNEKTAWKMQALMAAVFLANTLLIYFQLRLPENISFSPHGTALRWEHFRLLGMEVIADTLSGNALLSWCVILISTLWFAVKRQALLFLAGTAGLLVLFSIYYNPWHQGVLFLFWIYCLWRSFREEGIPAGSRTLRVVRPLVLIAVATVLIIQIRWNTITVVNDYRGSYSAGRELADYIKENGYDQKRIYGNYFWSVAVLPYFDDNIYYNYQYRPGRSFWTWTKENDWVEPAEDILAGNPDLIIMPKPHLYPYPDELPGYKGFIEFRGSIFWKNTIREHVIFRVFERE